MDGIERQRKKEVEILVDHAETAGHDANDLARLRVDLDRAADNARIAAKTALPVAVAEHDGLCAARILVGLREPATQERWNFECLQDTIADVCGPDFFRPGDAGHIGELRRPDAYRLEGAVVLRKSEVHGRRKLQSVDKARQASGAGSVEEKSRKAVRIRIRKRLEQHAIYHGENCCIGTNADRQRQKNRGCEAPGLPK